MYSIAVQFLLVNINIIGWELFSLSGWQKNKKACQPAIIWASGRQPLRRKCTLFEIEVETEIEICSLRHLCG